MSSDRAEDEPDWIEARVGSDPGKWAVDILRSKKQSRIRVHRQSVAREVFPGLCTTCRQVDFEGLLFGNIHTGFRDEYDTKLVVATVAEVKRNGNDGCNFCRYVLGVAIDEIMWRVSDIRNSREYFAREDLVDVKLWASDFGQREDENVDIRDLDYSVVRVALRSRDTSAGLTIESDYPVSSTALQLCDHPLSRFRSLEDRVDMQLCQEWFEKCVYNHPECQRSGSQETSRTRIGQPRHEGRAANHYSNNRDFKLIDIDRRQIAEVGSQVHVRYATLSYVCGKSETMWKLPKRSDLWILDASGKQVYPMPEKVPATVADAMIVAKQLGLSFLWVDSFCIAQDDPDELQSQIQAMATIYSNAQICIVAASGTDSHAGLPGVSVPREVEIKHQVGIKPGLTLGIRRPSFSEVLRHYKYMTRGWTYQELVLSNRCLVFTEHEAFFYCAGMTCRESSGVAQLGDSQRAWYTEDTSGLIDRFGNSSLMRSYCAPNNPENAFETYTIAVSEYSRRELSYQTDGLNAFQGLSNFIGQAMETDMLFGCPERYLVNSLNWNARLNISTNHREQPERRMSYPHHNLDNGPLLPSWTWLSCTGWRRPKTHSRYGQNTELQVLDRLLVPSIPATKTTQRAFMTDFRHGTRETNSPANDHLNGIIPIFAKAATMSIAIEDEMFSWGIEVFDKHKAHAGRCDADLASWTPRRDGRALFLQLWVRGTDRLRPGSEVRALMLDVYEMPQIQGTSGETHLRDTFQRNEILSTGQASTYQRATEGGVRLQSLPDEVLHRVRVDPRSISDQAFPRVLLGTRAGIGYIDVDAWLNAKPEDVIVLLG